MECLARRCLVNAGRRVIWVTAKIADMAQDVALCVLGAGLADMRADAIKRSC